MRNAFRYRYACHHSVQRIFRDATETMQDRVGFDSRVTRTRSGCLPMTGVIVLSWGTAMRPLSFFVTIPSLVFMLEHPRAVDFVVSLRVVRLATKSAAAINSACES